MSTRLLCLFAVAMTTLAWQPASGPAPKTAATRRLFVEPFTTKEGSEKLHDGVIAELRKLGTVSLAPTASAADVILGGGGEIWVRGYRSLNPRSGTSPSNGTPVYGGFLSVELRDPKGETLWSYLATPSSVSGDVANNLSKQIAKHVAEALKLDAAPPLTDLPDHPDAILHGAGGTFPYPLYAKWFTNYRRVNPHLDITYDPVGSEKGIQRLLSRDIDFAGSDCPLPIIPPSIDLSHDNADKYLFIPTAVGAVVPIVNLPGFTGEIAFTPEILAGIYLGNIRKWNDPALRQANPRLHLPDLNITVVHRADGSGTSYVWTDYLSQTSSQWKASVGAGLSPHWPAGKSATGNEGVAAMVKELGGSIGYVEFIYALQNHLSFGKVRNRNGEFVAASLESIGAAASKATTDSLADSPAPGAYPISSFTWLVFPAHIPDAGKRAALSGFLNWMLGPGQTQAATLGYLSLPKDVIGREEAVLNGIR